MLTTFVPIDAIRECNIETYKSNKRIDFVQTDIKQYETSWKHRYNTENNFIDNHISCTAGIRNID